MKPIKHLFVISILLLAAMAANGQEGKATLSFDCQQKEPTLTLNGDGMLYHWNSQHEKYKGTYYLFTDVHTIGIDPSSKLFDRNSLLVFKDNDKNSKWFSDTTCLGNDYRINNTRLQNAASKDQQICFKWGQHAYLFISSNANKQPMKSQTLFLVVLPTPPEDTLITKVETSLNTENDSLNGTITIHRTGRVIIDSVYVEGEKAYTIFNPKLETNDKPYYRNIAFAQVEIHRSWGKKNKYLNVVVYMKRFNDDSTITPCQEELQVELFEKTLSTWYWWLIGIIVLAMVVFLSILMVKNLKREADDDVPTQKQFMRLKKENEKLYSDLEQERKHCEIICDEMTKKAEYRIHDMEKKINTLQMEIERLKIPTQAAIDEAMFISKCNNLLEEIEKIRMTLKGKPELSELDEQLRNLEKIVIIKKQ